MKSNSIKGIIQAARIPLILALLSALPPALFPASAGGDSNSQMSLSFKDADARTVFETISKKIGRNIILHMDANPKINVSLEKVEPMEALELICKTHKLCFVLEKENTIIVYTREAFLSEGTPRGVESETVVIKNRSARDVFAQIAISGSSESPKASGGSGSSTPSKVGGSTTSFAGTGSISMGTGTGITPTGGAISFDEKDNTISILDTRANIAYIRTLIDRQDRKLRSVLIEARIILIDLKDENRFGINWNLIGQNATRALGINFPANSGGATFKATTDPVQTPISILAGNFSFDVMIEAISTKNNVRILSNPRISALSGEEAKIIVGKTIPYNVTTYTDKGLPVQDSKFVQTGIKLLVTPTIYGDMVRLKIHPESSKPTQATPGAAPVVDTSEADSTVYVKDGDSVVLGGLIETDQTKIRSGVPFLSKVPIIGILFGSSEDHNNRSELAVFIKVNIQ
jgi:type IV pilus assembly protein PilQ